VEALMQSLYTKISQSYYCQYNYFNMADISSIEAGPKLVA